MLVGINYDKKTKKHECRIERWEKTQVVSAKSQGVVKEYTIQDWKELRYDYNLVEDVSMASESIFLYLLSKPPAP